VDELLGGLVDEGEESAATAAREAAEESGWAPLGPPEKLISFEPLPGNVTAPMDVYDRYRLLA
jgi:ADP-ribose pyrophosphatase